MNKQFNAEIIAVGTEILLGDILNTNAQYISKEFAKLGINVYYQTVVGDNPNRLKDIICNAFSRSDIVITTGGLGPTDDDITKEVCSKYFGKNLILNEDILKSIKTFFDKNKKNMPENNIKQAYVPEDSIILYNENGTAPGIIFEQNNKILIMLPGPPKETIPMFKNSVKPFLEKKQNNVIVSKVLRVAGIGESSLEFLIKDFIKNENPTIATYAKDNEVILRITAKAENQFFANDIINDFSNKIYNILGDNIYTEGDISLQFVVAKLILDKNMTISISESCTGGLLAGTLIEYPGISEVFIEGIVSYSNNSKIKRLGVRKETLDIYGAVSEETAKEMAEGIAKFSGSNIGVSITGIAGPTGDTNDKPVGLVYIGLCINGITKVKKCNFFGNRNKIRGNAVYTALDFIRRELINI